MKKIYLSGKLGQGKFALVDSADFEWLNQWIWNYDKGYAYRTQRYGLRKFNKKKNIHMHRLILDAPKGFFTDHIDGNRLNNQRKNLRIVNYQQSAFNTGLSSRNKCGYKGVGWHKEKEKYRAYIKMDGHQKHLGYFKTKEEAARAFNVMSKKYHGEYARLNIL